jgi:PAS domain S-box-containing protein
MVNARASHTTTGIPNAMKKRAEMTAPARRTRAAGGSSLEEAPPRHDDHIVDTAYGSLFDQAADAIVLAHLGTGRIVAANPRAHALLGCGDRTLLHGTIGDLFDSRTASRLAALRPAAPPTRFEDSEAVTVNGLRFPVSIAASVVTMGGESRLATIVRDERERRRTETELREARERLEAQNAELRAAQARLLEIDRVRTEFLGMMSHELRTPVNIIIGYAHMLLESVAAGDPLPPQERAGVLRRMVAGGHALSELVEDTLSVLRLDAGVVRLELTDLALDALFHDLRGNDRMLRGPDAVDERWSVEPDVPEILTDRRKLRQVITNLVGNARKFTKTGYIDVKAIRIDGHRVRITVTDTGCGIDATHLPNIFELYRQAPSGQAHDGCGIGLYIVKRYIDMLGGRVECRSTVGVGSTFVIELPVRVPVADVAGRSAEPASGHAVTA